MRILVHPAPIHPDADLALFADERGNAGAMASFVGYCRALSGGAAIVGLELEHYPGFTQSEVERFAMTVVDRHQLLDLLVVHRVGAIAAGEAIVLIAALSEHRAAAFAAVQELMDYLKTDAPLWKREITAHGVRWIEPTRPDRERRVLRKKGP